MFLWNLNTSYIFTEQTTFFLIVELVILVLRHKIGFHKLAVLDELLKLRYFIDLNYYVFRSLHVECFQKCLVKFYEELIFYYLNLAPLITKPRN